jgi:CIC family chloride channel protein
MWATVLRSAASLCTIASGGSIGREGAMVQLAAATGSWIGQLGRFEGDKLRLLAGLRRGGGLRFGL